MIIQRYLVKNHDHILKRDSLIIERLKSHINMDNGGYLVFTPGRVNLNEYMDMLGSEQISFTTQMGIWSISEPRSDSMVKIKLILFDKEEIINVPVYMASINKKAEGYDDWKSFIWENPHYHRIKGDAVNYIIAPIARILFKAKISGKFKGYNIVIDKGNLPMEAGLSSSSALVTASGFHLLAHNRDIIRKSLTIGEMLGESEWYTGTRGGANDHITIIRGQRNKFLINDHSMSPVKTNYCREDTKDYSIFLYNSLFNAKKTENMLGSFNSLKHSFIHTAQRCRETLGIQYLADIGNLKDEALKKCYKELNEDDVSRRILSYFLFQREFLCHFKSYSSGNSGEMGFNLGKWLFRMHWNMSKNLKNSNTFIDSIIKFLEKEKGIIGSKMVGAGFGGSLIILSGKNCDMESLIDRINTEESIKRSFINSVKKLRLGEKEQKEMISQFSTKALGRAKEIYPVIISDGIKMVRI